MNYSPGDGRRVITYMRASVKALCTISSMQEERLVTLNEAYLMAKAFNLDRLKVKYARVAFC